MPVLYKIAYLLPAFFVIALGLAQPAAAVGKWEKIGSQTIQDYYAPVNKGFLNLVNRWHLLPAKKLRGRNAYGWNVGDIDYILRHLPNHPYGLRRATIMCTEHPDLLSCEKVKDYFKKAIDWSPKQPNTYALHGLFLQKLDADDEAIKQYLIALQLDPTLADAYYNIALVYMEREEYERAAKYAKSAYTHGHRSPGLKRKLQDKGYM